MAAQTNACSSCGREVAEGAFAVKRVDYRTPGPRGRVLRVRTVAHLCVDCVEHDTEWQLPRCAPFRARV